MFIFDDFIEIPFIIIPPVFIFSKYNMASAFGGFFLQHKTASSTVLGVLFARKIYSSRFIPESLLINSTISSHLLSLLFIKPIITSS